MQQVLQITYMMSHDKSETKMTITPCRCLLWMSWESYCQVSSVAISNYSKLEERDQAEEEQEEKGDVTAKRGERSGDRPRGRR